LDLVHKLYLTNHVHTLHTFPNAKEMSIKFSNKIKIRVCVVGMEFSNKLKTNASMYEEVQPHLSTSQKKISTCPSK
jgi:hypothetical protein